jgi:CRISPR-associated protein Csb1
MKDNTEQQPKKDPQLEADIALLDNLLGVEARKPGNAAKLPAAIRIIETLEPAGGKQVPVFPASYAGANDQSPPVYDLMGIEYGEGEDTVRVKNATAKIPRIVRAKMCAIDSPQSQANRMEPAFLESDLAQLVPQAKACIPRLADAEGETSVLTLPHRVADFRVRLSDKGSEAGKAITAFARGDCLPLLKTFPTSLIFGFWNSRGEEEQGVKHARILLARIDATDVVPCRRHSLYSGPYSRGEFAEAVLQRDISDEEAKKLSKEGFSAAPSDGLGGVLVNGTIERLALLSLTDIARLHCNPEESKHSEATETPVDTKQPLSENELTNAARRYIFTLAALAESHGRAAGSHRLRSGCELVAADDEKNKPKTVPLRFDFRGAQPEGTDGESLRQLYFNRARLIAIATDCMKVLGIQNTEISYTVTAITLSGKIVSSDQAAKEREKAEKAVKEAKEKASKAGQEAEEAEQKAETGTPAEKKKAEKARKKATELAAKLAELEAKLATPSTTDTLATNHPEAQPKADEPQTPPASA